MIASTLFLSLSSVSSAGPPAKIEVCHATGAAGYRLIEISSAAEASHLAHGDALPGELVPGGDGSYFDSDCGVVDAAVCGGFDGNWSGLFLQPDYSATPYPITLTDLECVDDGEVLAFVDYPGFPDCGGIWTMVEAIDSDTVIVNEQISDTYCINNCFYEVTFDAATDTISGVGVECDWFPAGTVPLWSFELWPD